MLRNIYNDKQSSFIKLQEKSNSFSLLQQNLQILAIEIYKVRNDLSSSLMRNIIELSIKIYILSKVFNFTPRVGSVYLCIMCLVLRNKNVGFDTKRI